MQHDYALGSKHALHLWVLLFEVVRYSFLLCGTALPPLPPFGRNSTLELRQLSMPATACESLAMDMQKNLKGYVPILLQTVAIGSLDKHAIVVCATGGAKGNVDKQHYAVACASTLPPRTSGVGHARRSSLATSPRSVGGCLVG